MAKLKPWYQVVTPREDLRDNRPLDASEFAVHLDHIRLGRAHEDYVNPQRFFARTFMTVSLRDLLTQVIRRHDESTRSLSRRRRSAGEPSCMVISSPESSLSLATKYALADERNDGPKWARIAIRATEARSTLLQDIGLLDRQIGTLFIADDSKPVERTPTGEELSRSFAEVQVTDAEIVSDAERAWLHGDQTAAEAAPNDAG